MTAKGLKTFITLCVFVAFFTVVANAQEANSVRYTGRAVDVKIFFPYDEAYIAPTYMSNEKTLRFVDSLLRDTSYISTISKIVVEAQSSPEGSVSYNARLSERRRQSLQKYFTENYPEVESSLWSFTAVAENWQLFRDHLAEDPDLPNRDEVLSIADGDREADVKEWLLKTMNGGEPWLYIKEHILPAHRFGASMLFIPNAHAPISPVATFASQSFPQMAISHNYAPIITAAEAEPLDLLFAIKTNLALDAATVVNIGVEVLISNRFSVVGEVIHPWWRNWERNMTLQIESYHGEVKYWLGERSRENRLKGWSVGLYGGWGRYDIQLYSQTGDQGTFYDLGGEIGYSHALWRKLHLEYTVGVGYFSTKYNDYYMAYDTEEFGDIKVIPYPWMNHKLRTIFPTRCAVSLVWHINPKFRKGGQR